MDQDIRSSRLTIWPVYWQRWVTASDITHSYMHILHLIDEDAILVILFMDLPITTSNAGQCSNL